MVQPEPWTVTAHNTATLSQNKIHDDEVARRYGFRGGLVPGVDDYAYMTHVPAEIWGLAWLERGTMSARFHLPVYEGQQVEVRPGPIERDGSAQRVALELLGPDGTVCATGHADLDDDVDPEVVRPAARLGPLPDPPPPASSETLAVGTRFTLPARAIGRDAQVTYLDDVRETLPLYLDEGVVHPGALLRLANRILGANVTLGPWIHVSSDVAHRGLVRHGDEVGARSVVTAEWERKGHRFVTLDVELVVVDGDTERVVTSITHTAIHQPRS